MGFGEVTGFNIRMRFAMATMVISQAVVSASAAAIERAEQLSSDEDGSLVLQSSHMPAWGNLELDAWSMNTR